MIETLPAHRPGQPNVAEFRVNDYEMPWAFEAIGRLVQRYVNLEHHIVIFFGTLTGLPWPESTLLQGDGRPSTYMSAIRRLSKFKGYSLATIQHTDMAFKEVNHLKAIRDIVAHCDVSYTWEPSRWMLFHNVFTASFDKRREMIMSADDLLECSNYTFELARHIEVLRTNAVPEPSAFHDRPALLDILHPHNPAHHSDQEPKRRPPTSRQ